MTTYHEKAEEIMREAGLTPDVEELLGWITKEGGTASAARKDDQPDDDADGSDDDAEYARERAESRRRKAEEAQEQERLRAETLTESGWVEFNWTDVINGTYVPLTAQVFYRTDGVGMAYRGMTHRLHGPGDAGKTTIMLFGASQVLKRGGHVVWIGYEDDGSRIGTLLIKMGVTGDQLRAGFHCYMVSSAFDVIAREAVKVNADRAELVVIDSTGEALAARGGKKNADEDVTAFMTSMPRWLARCGEKGNGPAVWLIDHTNRSFEVGEEHSGGSQRLSVALSGAAFMAVCEEPLTPGEVGRLALYEVRDKHGGIRPHCERIRKDARVVRHFGTFVFDSTDPARVEAYIEPPDMTPADRPAAPKRPTKTMEQVSDVLAAHPGGLPSWRSMLAAFRAAGHTAKDDDLRAAIECLKQGAYVNVTPRSQGTLHTLNKPYRADLEGLGDWSSPQCVPASQVRPTASPTQPSKCVPASHPLKGGRTQHQLVTQL